MGKPYQEIYSSICDTFISDKVKKTGNHFLYAHLICQKRNSFGGICTVHFHDKSLYQQIPTYSHHQK